MYAELGLIPHVVSIGAFGEVVSQGVGQELLVVTHLGGSDRCVIELEGLDFIFLLVVPEDHLTFSTCRHHEEIVSTVELERVHWEEEMVTASSVGLGLLNLVGNGIDIYLMSLEGHDVLEFVVVWLVVARFADEVTHVASTVDRADSESITIGKQTD